MDGPLSRFLNGLLSAPGAELWPWLGTRPATLLYMALVVAWVASTADRRRWLWPAVVAVLITDLSVSHVWKPTFERSRPCVEHPTMLTAPPGEPRRCGDDPSFPSGHASSSAAIAAATMSPPLLALSALTGVQRVVTAQHWPSDVVVGWIYGWFIGLAVRRSAAKLRGDPPQ